jgi:hypothetical protein
MYTPQTVERPRHLAPVTPDTFIADSRVVVYGSLRAAMHAREGRDEAERQIGRGLHAWAVRRTSPCLHRTDTAIVFGKVPSDAKRRAASPARLGEEVEGDITDVARIVSGWDAPLKWPDALAVTP